MSKRLVHAVSILPALVAVAVAPASGADVSSRVDRGSSGGPRVLGAPLELPPALRGPSTTAPVLGPGVLGGTSTAGAQAQTIGTLPRVLVGNTPQAAVFDPATRTVYVANQNDNTLSVVDARHCNATDTSGCGQTPPTVAGGTGPGAIAIDDATHTIYVTDAFSDTVSVIDAKTCNATKTSGCGQTPDAITVGDGPAGIALDPATNTVYVTIAGPGVDGSGDTVSVINGATCNATNTAGCKQTPASITVGRFPFNPALDTANGTLYVTDALDNTVSMVDTARCNATDTSGCGNTPPTAAVGQFPNPVAVDSRTDTVYVGNGNQATVSVIDGATCNATDTTGCLPHPTTLRVPGGPDGLAINETTETLFVDNNGPGTSTARENSVSVINATTCNATVITGCGQRAPTALTGANPAAPTVDEATDTTYVPTFDNTLQVIDGATCNVTVITGCGQPTPATLAGNVPYSLAINQATKTVYVGDSGLFDGYPWTISVLDAGTCNTLDRTGCTPHPATIPMKFNPTGVAVDQATDTLYATNNGTLVNGAYPSGGTVSVIDGASCNATVSSGCRQPAPTVKVGSYPQAVAVNEATDTIYVANAGDNTLSVIDGESCNAKNSTGCHHAPATVPLASTALYGSTAVAVNEVTDTVYVINEGTPSTVSVLNGATCNGRITTGCGTQPPTVTVGNASGLAGLSVNQRTNTIYVDNTADDTISVINGAACNGTHTSGCGKAPARVAVGRQSWGFVAVDPATDLVYASNYLDDTVSIIDGAICNAGHTAGCNQTPPAVPVAGNPAELNVDRHNHNIYVANNGDGPVSFFRFQTPGTPTRVSASIYNGQAEVVWKAPADGGLPIIYHVIPTPACRACTGLTTPSPSGAPYATINGLSPGQRYTFKVQGTDAAGTGPSSAPSNAITR